jgi:uncharacterized protein
MARYTTIVTLLVLIGLAWFLTRVRRAVRRLQPMAEPLIGRARAQREMQELDDRPLDELFVEARSGNAAAQYKLGILYAGGNGLPHDETKAVAWYERAAASGFVEAQYCLGLHYERGLGVKQDDEHARSWYEKAAVAGEPRAQCNLGVLFSTGRGGDVSLLKFRKRADEGDLAALLLLGWVNEVGFGVPESKDEARRHYERAQSQGHLFAHNLLARL